MCHPGERPCGPDSLCIRDNQAGAPSPSKGGYSDHVVTNPKMTVNDFKDLHARKGNIGWAR
jgi:hypothetical protein